MPKMLKVATCMTTVFLGAAACIVCSLLVGCAGLSGLSPFAYPHFWDYTRRQPKEPELVGSYKIRKLSRASFVPASFRPSKDVWMVLNADHTAVLSGIPAFDGFGDVMLCAFSGPATWTTYARTSDWWVDLRSKLQKGSGRLEPSGKRADSVLPKLDCGANWNQPLLVLGQHAPYRLYLTVGDPDEDVGIEFQKQP
jgi:hypothetical protein